MSYSRNQLSTSPPPMYFSDGYLTSPYNNFYLNEQKMQFAGQQPTSVVSAPVPVTPAPVPVTPVPVPITPAPVPVTPAPVVMAPAPMTYSVPQQPVQAPVTVIMQQPQVPQIPKLVIKPKGWDIVNIILCILIMCSCVGIILNLINGTAGSIVCTIICLCLIYSIYSWYNKEEKKIEEKTE